MGGIFLLPIIHGIEQKRRKQAGKKCQCNVNNSCLNILWILAGACLASATWPSLYAPWYATENSPLQRSILKSRCADGQYIYTGIPPPLPPHTDQNLTRPYYYTSPPSTLQHGLPPLTGFLPSIAPRVHYPPFPSYVLFIMLPSHPFSFFLTSCRQISVMRVMHTSSSRLFVSTFFH